MDSIIAKPEQRMLLSELACRALKSSPALPLWLKLIELNGLPESQKRGCVFASQKWLAKELGYSSEPKDGNGECTYRNGARTVQRRLDDLYALGMVHWRRAGRGRNNYFLAPASVEETRRLYSGCTDDKNVACPAPNVASNVASPGQNVASEPTKMSPPLHAEIKDNELREQGSSSAAAAEKEKAKEDNYHQAIQIFASLEIPAEKLRELVAAVRWHVAEDPDLGLEVARHCGERLADKTAEPPRRGWTAYAVGAFKDPGAYSISQIDGVWRRPAPNSAAKPPPEDRAKADAELNRQREEAAKRDALFRAMPIRTMKREVTPCPK